MDRVQEVIMCERELMDGNVYKPLPVLLNLSFDEVCVIILHYKCLRLSYEFSYMHGSIPVHYVMGNIIHLSDSVSVRLHI